MNGKILSAFAFFLLLFLAACQDQGDPITANVPTPSLTSVSPDSGKANDTITVVGTNFGDSRGSSALVFGSTNAGAYISWNATQIKAVVPSGLAAGNLNVTVSVSGKTSNTKTFKALSAVTVSFSADVLPLFTGAAYGCTGCHGGQNNLFLDSYNGVLSGNIGFSPTAKSNNGPVITPNNASGSILVKKLRASTLPFGSRMPFGGAQMSDVDLQKIITWINQGALNN